MGLLDGVVETKPGWIGKMEVVEVTYDPKVTSIGKLVAKAETCKCALKVFTRSDAQQKLAQALIGERAVRSDAAIRVDDDKYYTSRTPLANLPMTPLQATLVNERIGAKKDPSDLLAPSQVALWGRLTKEPERKWPKAIGVDFVTAWAAAQKHAADVKAPKKATR